MQAARQDAGLAVEELNEIAPISGGRAAGTRMIASISLRPGNEKRLSRNAIATPTIPQSSTLAAEMISEVTSDDRATPAPVRKLP